MASASSRLALACLRLNFPFESVYVEQRFLGELLASIYTDCHLTPTRASMLGSNSLAF